MRHGPARAGVAWPPLASRASGGQALWFARIGNDANVFADSLLTAVGSALIGYSAGRFAEICNSANGFVGIRVTTTPALILGDCRNPSHLATHLQSLKTCIHYRYWDQPQCRGICRDLVQRKECPVTVAKSSKLSRIVADSGKSNCTVMKASKSICTAADSGKRPR